MRIYMVGGAVRDSLLGLEAHERDWVVVGATPKDMRKRGFRPVGKDFPVFLHPRSGEEYALARTERKDGVGYHGFTFHTEPTVSLEEDLRRRDLTINAIAQDEDGNLFDPYNGRKDLEAKILRHVSPAFSEDPLRVLRVARFQARFHGRGFTIAEDTMDLMRTIVKSGELRHLSAERIWTETKRALEGADAAVYFETLRACGALAEVMPEVDALFGVPQPKEHHPEEDTGVHTMMCLRQACEGSEDPVVRFAVLVHDIGKGATPKEHWPKHHGHEERGYKLLQNMRERMKIPNDYYHLAGAVCRWHTLCHRALELKPETMLQLLQQLDYKRRPQQLEDFLLACTFDARGRDGFEQTPYPQAQWVARCAEAARACTFDAAAHPDKKDGPAIKKAVYEQTLAAIKALEKPA